MFQIDFFQVADGESSGDAIALRIANSSADPWVTGIIDAGFKDSGDRIVRHFRDVYETDQVDFVLLTHPDQDHVGGMGEVMRGLDVVNLLVHRPAKHGYPNNSGAKPAEELVELADEQDTVVTEPFTGVSGFDNMLHIAGPTKEYYKQMLAEQEETTKAATPTARSTFGLAEAVVRAAKRALAAFPIETAFDDAGGTNPRNNSSAITHIQPGDSRLLFTGDAGVPALNQAMDFLDGQGETASLLSMFQIPHHGSRHNLDRDTCERILGSHTDERRGCGVVSVAKKNPKNPAPRIANACGRRGYRVWSTASVENGDYLFYTSPDAPRNGTPVDPLPPMAEPED